MLIVPIELMLLLQAFAPLFSERVWDWAQVLVVGAILAPGKRTVTAALRVMGLSAEEQFQNYHRVLNRAKWSALAVSQILLGLLIGAFVATGVPLVLGADETLERRRGEKIKAKGAFRDAVRSSKKYTVISFGLRWVCMMLLVPVPWSSRGWALPFLTVLAPSKATHTAQGKRHKTSVDWIGQMLRVVRRWHPKRALILVVDGGLAAIKLGLVCQHFAQPVIFVSRLRLDARLFDPPGPQPKSKRGPKPKKGPRQPSLTARLADPKTLWTALTLPWYSGQERCIEYVTGCAYWHTPGRAPLPVCWVLVRDPEHAFDPHAFFATDLTATPTQILTWVIQRWGMEVTFEEARAHVGVETQRQWSDLAIARTTPALFGLFALITVLAHRLVPNDVIPVRTAAWYLKPEATFSDVIALVRRYLWTHVKFVISHTPTGLVSIPATLFEGLMDSVCYAT